MNRRLVVACLALLALAPPVASAETWRERPDWAPIFQQAGVGGTIVVARIHFPSGEGRTDRRIAGGRIAALVPSSANRRTSVVA